MNTWQLQEAKNKFSELVERARTEGPQLVTRRGQDAVVIIAVDEFERLRKPKQGLVEFIRDSPLAKTELDLERLRDLPREADI